MARQIPEIMLISFAAVALLDGELRADDWPTYKGDPQRSGVTAEPLELPLAARWVYEPALAPMPAWPEPGKELHRMDFDYAPQPVVAGGLVYFASSADDTVRALEAATGELVWRFTAGGPIRFAPSVADGNVYVASDDGWLYCLNAGTGELVWRFQGAPDDDQILGNGRMISRWPCRSDALVVHELVYFTAGMWPTEGVYVYAVDAKTGKERWCNDSSGAIYVDLPHPGATGFSGVAPQGYLLVQEDTLLVATGRCVPAAFDRHTGRLLYYKPASALYHGAAWTTASGDLYFNPKNRFQNPSEAHIGEAQPSPADGMFAYSFVSGEREFTLAGKYRVLASDGVLFAVGKDSLQAIDLEALRRNKRVTTKDIRWTTPYSGRVYCLAKAGGTLLAGSRGGITAFDATTGRCVWKSEIDGQVRGLAVADGRLIATTHEGLLLCFEHTGRDVACKHLKEEVAPPAVSVEHAATAEDVLSRSGKSEGYALVIGESDSRLAEAIAAQTDLHVLCVLGDASSAAAERERLLAGGLYGRRVCIQAVDDLAQLPFGAYFADLVVVSDKVKGVGAKECYRVLRPCGGALCFVGFEEREQRRFVGDADITPGEAILEQGLVVRGPLPGAGEWRYPWADGGRTGIGNERRVRLPLDVLWFGGPGPDRLMDRHWMPPPPVSAAGRVFMVGQHHVIALDAYNGRELWSRHIPGVGRKYSQYYSSNLVADEDSVYVLKRDRCHRLDQVTGKTRYVYGVPESVLRGTPPPVVQKYVDREWPGVRHVMSGRDPNMPDLESMIWGYVSAADGLVLGSLTVRITEGQSAESHLIWRSESVALFALDKRDGSLRWVYRPRRNRTISNIEIAFGDGRLFLIDGTSKVDSTWAKRRGERTDVELTLVALDLATGRELWRQDDVPVLADRSQPPRLKSNPSHLFMGLPNWGHLVYSDGVVVLGANAAYDAADGRKLWQKDVRPQKLPVVHGRWLIAQPYAYDLRTGRERMTKDILTGQEVPWRYGRAYGCGPVNGCRGLLFFRSGADGFFDMTVDGTTNFGGVRPNCSRSLIAAGGLLIHPEGYSGCCCAYNYQTSLALVSAVDRTDTWYVFPQRASTGPLERMAVNFGAPGDRRDRRGVAWLGFPRPIATGACPAPVRVLMENASCYCRPRVARSIKGTDSPWLYVSGLRGGGRVVIGLVLEPNLVVPACDTPPTINGKLDDPCWKHARAVSFQNTPFTLLGANVDLRIARDTENLYFGYHRKPIPGARTSADEATLASTDGFEIYVTDHRKKTGIRCGVKRNGTAFARCGTVDRYRKVDPAWRGEWQHGVQQGPGQWMAEVAVPLKTLTDSGIDVKNLQLNCMSQNLTGSGLESIFLVDPAYGGDFRRCVRFRRVVDRPPDRPSERSFQVRLHFAEIDEAGPAERVFDVAIQGRTVLKGFDVRREAGARNTALVKQFGGVAARDQITVDLIPELQQEGAAQPVLCAIEVAEEP